MLNDCGEMMVSDKLTGQCTAGFAKRNKVKKSWVIDGQLDEAVETKLVPVAAAPVPAAAPAEAPSASLGGLVGQKTVGRLGIEVEKDTTDNAARHRGGEGHD